MALTHSLHAFGQFHLCWLHWCSANWTVSRIEGYRTATSSSSSSPLSLIRLFCGPFIISHLTIRQNGTVAVKHLQGCSTGHASTFCLAISLSVKGTRQIGWESIWWPRSSGCLRERARKRERGAEKKEERGSEPISNNKDRTTRICNKGCKVYSLRKLIWKWIKQLWQIWW